MVRLSYHGTADACLLHRRTVIHSKRIRNGSTGRGVYMLYLEVLELDLYVR